MRGHESTAVVVVTLQLKERTSGHKVLRVKFPEAPNEILCAKRPLSLDALSFYLSVCLLHADVAMM